MICFGFVEGQIYYSPKNPKYQSSMIFIKLNSQVCFVYKNKYNERQKKKEEKLHASHVEHAWGSP